MFVVALPEYLNGGDGCCWCFDAKVCVCVCLLELLGEFTGFGSNVSPVGDVSNNVNVTKRKSDRLTECVFFSPLLHCCCPACSVSCCTIGTSQMNRKCPTGMAWIPLSTRLTTCQSVESGGSVSRSPESSVSGRVS